jgi:hypothetical protein
MRRGDQVMHQGDEFHALTLQVFDRAWAISPHVRDEKINILPGLREGARKLPRAAAKTETGKRGKGKAAGRFGSFFPTRLSKSARVQGDEHFPDKILRHRNRRTQWTPEDKFNAIRIM